MQFRYTILYVEDVRSSLEFYETAFGLKRGFMHEAGDYGELITGETKLAFASRALMQELGKIPSDLEALHTPESLSNFAPSFEIALETDDVAAAITQASKAGAEIVQQPQEQPWGQTTAYVRDPNGHLIELCSPVQSRE